MLRPNGYYDHNIFGVSKVPFQIQKQAEGNSNACLMPISKCKAIN